MSDAIDRSRHLTPRDLACLVGIRTRVIERMVRLELLEPVTDAPEPLFPPDTVRRARRLVRLHHQLGVSWSSMELVLDLLDRIDALERELQSLRRPSP